MLRSGVLTDYGKSGFDKVTECATDHDVDIARRREQVSSKIQRVKYAPGGLGPRRSPES